MIIAKLALVAIVIVLWYSLDNITGNVVKETPDKDPYPSRDVKALTIANWNLEIYGAAKAAKETLLQDYADIIDDFDIMFVQEIRDKNGSAFQALCDHLPQYKCKISSRAGRSSSKEQYGVLYRSISLETGKEISMVNWEDYNPDKQDRWERPPLAVTFDVAGYQFTVYNIHVKPAAVQQELAALEQMITNKGNILLMGDFNADCSYYNSQQEKEFDAWHWILGDTDTSVGQQSCAYDRIILNDDALEEFGKKGIVSEGITEEHSDHYVVWVGIEPREK